MRVEKFRLTVKRLGPTYWVVEGHPSYPKGLIGPGNPQGRGGRKTPLVSFLSTLKTVEEVAKAIEWVGRFRVAPPNHDDHKFRIVGGCREGWDLCIGGLFTDSESTLADRRIRHLIPELRACETLEAAQKLLDSRTSPA